MPFTDPKFKAEVVQALRSGDYKQGHRLLCKVEDKTYCCLGVMTKLAGDLKLSKNLGLFKGNISWYNIIPPDTYGLTSDEIVDLWRRNDGAFNPETERCYHVHTFDEIADFIEENL